MSSVSKEQIRQAKEIDLLTYMQQYEPTSIKQTGRNEYCLIEHDSLKISNGLWHWFSQDIGGKTALAFLIHVRGMDFVEAVQTLVDRQIAPAPVQQSVKPKPPKPFELPKANRCGFHAVQYLQKRGIDSEIISRCIQEGTFYEAVKYHNCVFVGRDKEQKARFACVRGITDRFMMDIEGSDKEYSFSAPTRKQHSKALLVFESPIDALSQATLDKQVIGDLWDIFGRLSLGGVSPLPLMRYLKEHPEIESVFLCLDNDDTGRKTTKKIIALLKEAKHPITGKEYSINVCIPTIGKDWNNTLTATIAKKKELENRPQNRTVSLI